MNWLKWHVGTFTDPKFAVIAKKAGQSRAVVLAVWAALLETACNDVKRGDVSSFNPEDIAAALDIEPEAVTTIFAAIMARGLVTEDRLVASWAKRGNQDYSTDRVRKFREKQRQENHPSPPNETHETRFTVSETPGNAEEKRGEEKRIISPSPKRAARLPADWKLPDEWRVYSVQNRPDLDADSVAEDFRDYWHSRAGPDAAKLDWFATWRRWVRNQKGRTNGNGTHTGKQRLTPEERREKDLAGILKGMGTDVYGRVRAGAGEDREAGPFSLDGSEGPTGTG